MSEPTKFCFQCGQINNLNAQFCQKCGTRYEGPFPPVEPKPSVLTQISIRNPVFWIVTVLVGLFFGSVLILWLSKPTAPVAHATVSPTLPIPTPTPDISPAERLAWAKKEMASEYCRYWCPVATGHLGAIQADAKEYKEAVRLLAVLKERNAKGEAAQKREREKIEAANRKTGAENVERGLLSKGYDATVTVSGPGNRTIKITYVLMSRPLVYQLVEGGFLDQLRSQGFTKAIFADGYGTWWSYNL